MPGFNELGRGKLGIGLEKLFGISVAGALRSMSPELSAVAQLPVSVEELMGVSGFGRWSSGFDIQALAGSFARWQIRNPVGSGVLVILERVSCGGSVLSSFVADGGYATITDLGTGALSDFRDGRTKPRGGGAAIVTHERSVVLAPTSASVVALASVQVEIPICPIILLPGNAYLFGCTSANTTCFVTMVWRERGATPAELATQ